MKTIGVVTSSRADYGIYRPILAAIESEPDLDLALIVTGMHWMAEFGTSAHDIEKDGYAIRERLPLPKATDTPDGVIKAIAAGLDGFADIFARWRPDILMVLGDRYDMYPAALAALPFRIPVAHVHGGEVTEGAIDDALRHSMTKLAHLHFVSTETYGKRVEQLGEEPWRVFVCGAPSLDNLDSMTVPSLAQFQRDFGWSEGERPLLVTFHAVTLEGDRNEAYIRALLAALEQRLEPIVFTAPNSDPGGQRILRTIEDFVARHPRARLMLNLGTQRYFGLMAHAVAMVGNSSSGVIEAGAFDLPVVNIGTRQKGRVRGANVIDTDYATADIVRGLTRATDPGFRRSLAGVANPYGGRGASKAIARTLRDVKLDERLVTKMFSDLALQQA